MPPEQNCCRKDLAGRRKELMVRGTGCPTLHLREQRKTGLLLLKLFPGASYARKVPGVIPQAIPRFLPSYFMRWLILLVQRGMSLHSALMQDVGSSLLWKQHIMTSHSSLRLLMTIGSCFRDIKAENLTQDHKWNWNFSQGPDYKIFLLEKKGM